MGTRSFIAMKKNGKFIGVYCHWDGYLEYNGQILQEHYTSWEKVECLIDHGDMSSLAPEIGEGTDFANPKKGQCIFYHRDRGEDLNIGISQTRDEIMIIAEQSGCEYVYLFENDQWRYAERGPQFFGMSDGSSFSNLKSLKQALAKMNSEA